MPPHELMKSRARDASGACEAVRARPAYGPTGARISSCLARRTEARSWGDSSRPSHDGQPISDGEGRRHLLVAAVLLQHFLMEEVGLAQHWLVRHAEQDGVLRRGGVGVLVQAPGGKRDHAAL